MTAASRSKGVHPLSGADLGTLLRVVAQQGLPDPGHRLRLAAVFGAAVGRLPFTLAERAAFATMTRSRAAVAEPIFIVGHWRSGTTHLYNLMSQSSAFGYVSPFAAGMPWDLLGLVRALRPLLERCLPDGRYIDNVRVTPESPQEDEFAIANMTPLSFYHALYFPRRFQAAFDKGVFLDGATPSEIDSWCATFDYFLRKVAISQGRPQVIIKNPVYTARVALLSRMYPNARFIHIYRNPFVVYESMKNFYARLLGELALQSYGHIDIDGLVLGTYERMMDALVRDAAALPEDRFCDLRFEAFESDPIGELRTVYDRLGLGDFDAARPAFERYLASVSGYRKNRYAYDAGASAQVGARWARFVERWDYQAPAEAPLALPSGAAV